MKTIKIEKTKIAENKVKFDGDKDKNLTYKDLIEICLDVLPQGGFTPEGIRDRNRIQKSLDGAKAGVINIEDADFKNLEKLVKASRWTIRDKELATFLDKFEDGDYNKK